MRVKAAWGLALGIGVVAALSARNPVQAQGPKLHTLTEQEIMDMMLGSSIQASRGANRKAAAEVAMKPPIRSRTCGKFRRRPRWFL